MTRRILVAGIGNMFLGDDAFGCEVLLELSRAKLPADVHAEDFGLRARDLAYTLVEGWDAAIFVDAAPRAQAPGTVYVIEPKVPDATATPPLDGHSVRLEQVLALATQLGKLPLALRIVGCEPQSLEGDDEAAGLSPAVQAAIQPAVGIVQSLITELRGAAHA